MLANPDDLKALGEGGENLARLMMAMSTLQMAECGLVEEEKHSSIVYAEQHADELFKDGGAEFFRKYKEATEKAQLEQKKRNEMEKMIKAGDTEGQMRIIYGMMRAMDKMVDEKCEKEGWSPITSKLDDPFHNTIVDDELFQPRPPQPDCPICFLPLPERNACCYQACCGKVRRRRDVFMSLFVLPS